MKKIQLGKCVVLVAGLLAGGTAGAWNMDTDHWPSGYFEPRVVETEVATTPDPDPFERFNRSIFQFNSGVDRAILTPVARGYRHITPDGIEGAVTNFFSNLNDVTSAINNLLQGKPDRTLSDIGRILINTTLGFFGVMDVASYYNIPKYGADLGQTLATWGFGSGPYLVLPFLGPSSVRDAVGIVGDWFFDPLFYVDESEVFWTAVTLRYVDRRSGFLIATDIAEQAALDPYIFYREAYLQKRGSQTGEGAGDPDEDF